jgi:hypothetical protein
MHSFSEEQPQSPDGHHLPSFDEQLHQFNEQLRQSRQRFAQTLYYRQALQTLPPALAKATVHRVAWSQDYFQNVIRSVFREGKLVPYDFERYIDFSTFATGKSDLAELLLAYESYLMGSEYDSARKPDETPGFIIDEY